MRTDKFGNPLGMPTPWGNADSTTHLRPGVLLVQTPSHGGVLIGKRAAQKLLSAKARAIGERFGNFLAFEEDCDAAAVMYEHPEWFKYDEDIEALRTYAKGNLERWNPAYFLVKPCATCKQREGEFRISIALVCGVCYAMHRGQG